ncbi:unnamed protein product [Rhizophagus irregularis]|uniref:Uncharacterized protein n=1 Tax=Rhizophagus irregularis TaxID=588596 RepID=A0A915YX31_9GLOM|nr:hypothetical protein RIR_jg37378.t1 [Rhizophagus irregularis DAOM 181602=DAOM 197198]CAB5351610.1 unnamed protein product [Rhizophagus irregularis]
MWRCQNLTWFNVRMKFFPYESIHVILNAEFDFFWSLDPFSLDDSLLVPKNFPFPYLNLLQNFHNSGSGACTLTVGFDFLQDHLWLSFHFLPLDMHSGI